MRKIGADHRRVLDILAEHRGAKAGARHRATCWPSLSWPASFAVNNSGAK
jgi:hypothetical protein